MRYLLLAYLLTCPSALLLHAQNLVPNASFEEYSLCPTDQAQIIRADGWSAFSGTPDYFNRCNTNDSMDVPSNAAGYQEAFEGDAYAGMITYVEGQPLREVIQMTLSAPLIPGIPIYISLRASPGGFGNAPSIKFKYASSGIGIKFSMAPRHSPSILWPGNVALALDSALSDTSTWALVSGTYIPDSAYTQVFIGCFLPDPLIHLTLLDTNAFGPPPQAYAFVDNVCVSTSEIDCPLSVRIQEMMPHFWNSGSDLVADELHLRFQEQMPEATLTIYDAVGRKCSHTRIAAGTIDWTGSIAGLVTGTYVLHLETNAEAYQPIRIIHVSP